MSAAEVMAPADAAPADVAEAPTVDPPAAPVDEEEEEELVAEAPFLVVTLPLAV